jgi:L-lactate dehydrogenase complex protein LldF
LDRLKELEEAVGRRLSQGPVKGLYAAMVRGLTSRAVTVREIPNFDEFRAEVRRIRERSLARLPQLLEMFVRNAERYGAKVHYARDATEANKIIWGIIEASGARRLVKSKSLTSEEIMLNESLEDKGVEVVETDLGERIIQLARERPSHLVFPAIHRSRGDVASLFSREAGSTIGDDIHELLEYIRLRLRKYFLEASVGLNGANVGIAELGAVVLETNEGNGRLVASIPKVQIVLIGVEKIVETLEEALLLARAHAVSATGQRVTTYVSLMAGRAPLSGEVGGRELHIILLDNGRMGMLEDAYFREALYCIRCGACMNVCAPYSVVGGHLFGHIYPGPIGIPWTANVHGVENSLFAHLCVSCGLCREVCPALINIPLMISRVKELLAERMGHPRVNRAMMMYERLAKVASRLAPVSNWGLRSRVVRYLLEKAVGLDRSVAIPEFRRDSFDRRFRRIRRQVPQPRGRVVIFTDIFANYSRPEIGEALVRALYSAGLDVELPEQLSSGYPLIAYGDLEGARRYAERNLELLWPYVSRGYEVVSIEPTATYTLRHVYPCLLRGDARAEELASHTREALGVLRELVDKGEIEVKSSRRSRYGVHVPCHQRALSGADNILALAGMAGLDVEVFEDGMCCGMGGTFGMKRGPIGRGLALSVGERLFRLFTQGRAEAILTESSVCAIHLREGTGLEVLHPLEVLEFMAKK